MKNIIDSINETSSAAIKNGIAHLYTENEKLTSNILSLNGSNVVNFGSCSYLGLEFDNRLIDGAINGIRKYGTQFSASRSYISCGLYAELEERLNVIFNAYCVVTPTTTLGHISTIPTIIEKDDLVIMDHQVHHSVQTAVQLLKAKGSQTEIIRHNRMDLLEDRILTLRGKYKKIWYMADGVYSMYGDKAPIDTLYRLLNKYSEFHLYVDDAHGMSCYGVNGQGYVLSNHILHEKMILATSLNKAFAAGGGVVIFPNKKLAQKVRQCGGPMITSGPMQPSALGAAVACADIHLSDNIQKKQDDLHENIKYANMIFQKLEIPLVANNDTPIFFAGVGLPKVGYNLVRRMLQNGFYTNIGIFPAVPMKNTGVRFTITKLHTFNQIEKLAETMAYHYPLALAEEGYSMEEVHKSFGMETDNNKQDKAISSLVSLANLLVEHRTSISEIDKSEWNEHFEGKGSFDWDGLKLLEETFQNNPQKENNWVFDYITIKNSITNKTILKTFVTTSLNKDDMLSDADVSLQIELKRNSDPYYLTSKIVSLGSNITLGEHLYIDLESELYKEALEYLLSKLTDIQRRENANAIMLRDFSEENHGLHKIITENGYFKAEISDNHVINDIQIDENLMAKLSKKNKISFRKNVLEREKNFTATIVENPTNEQVSKWYNLYLNLKKDKVELNTFPLPFKFFENIAKSKNYEVIELKMNNRNTLDADSVLINFKSGDTYSLMIIGLDYQFSLEKIYQQTLYQGIKRAKEIGMKKVVLGFTSSLEKRRLGARKQNSFSYIQINDHYNMEVIQNMTNQKYLNSK